MVSIVVDVVQLKNELRSIVPIGIYPLWASIGHIVIKYRSNLQDDAITHAKDGR